MPEPKKKEPEPSEDVSARFILPLKNQDLDEGEDVLLRCKATGQPKPEITWLKDGDPILESEGVSIMTSPDGSCSLTVKGKFLVRIEIMLDKHGPVSHFQIFI